MKKLRVHRNQVIITALALMIAAAGYIRYADKNLDKAQEGTAQTAKEEAAAQESNLIDIESLDADITDTDTAEVPATDAESAAVDPAAAAPEERAAADTAETPAESAAADPAETPGEAVLTGASAYMAQAKLDREQMRSQNKETLQQIIGDETLSEEERQKAVESMVAITETVEKEAAAEMLLEAQGFTDSVVNLSGDTADVVVPMAQLGDDMRAQIEDIVVRKTGVAAENIVITPID